MSALALHSAAFVAVTALLLVVATRARVALGWRLLLSGAAAAAYIVQFEALGELAGSPRPGPLPAQFDVLGTRIGEPQPSVRGEGFIELWIRIPGQQQSRLYRLPYQAELAARVGETADRLGQGRPQVGWRDDGAGEAAARIGFGDRPPPRLPPKK